MKFLSALVAVIFISGSALSQSVRFDLDYVAKAHNLDYDNSNLPGPPIGDSIPTNTPIGFFFRLTNESGANITFHSNPVYLYSPDGADWKLKWGKPYFFEFGTFPVWEGSSEWPQSWHGYFDDYIGGLLFDYPLEPGEPYRIYPMDTIQWIGLARSTSDGLPNGFSGITQYVVLEFDDNQIGKTFCIDSISALVPDVTPWSWQWECELDHSTTMAVDWNGPHCFTIVNCCQGTRGNVNMDPDDKVNISDLTYLTDYLFGQPAGPAPLCSGEANINGDPDGTFNISDLTFLVCYLFCVPPGPAPPGCE